LKDIAKRALDKGLIAGAITLRKTAPDAAMHTLLTDSKMLDDADPLIPYFPGNSANFIKKLTKLEPTQGKLLAILRPCEMRASVELVKLAQIQNQNIIWLVHDCYGTLQRKDYSGIELPSGDEFFAKVQKEFAQKIRPICTGCDFARTDTCDIGFLIFENNSPFVAYTDTGKEFLKSLGIEFLETAPAEGLEKVSKDKADGKKALYEKLSNEAKGLDNILKKLSRCINCHNCMANCPICICRECFFESEALDFEGDSFVELAMRKGGLRAPTDVMLFHIGRMSHMATSCIACGACEEACPEDIPIGQIFKWVSEDVQAEFDYVAGRKWDDELPLKTFREEELEPK